MKQLLHRFWQWLGRLLGEFDTPRNRRETDGLPRDGEPLPRPHLRMRTPPGERLPQDVRLPSGDLALPDSTHPLPPPAPAERESSAALPAPPPSFDLHTGETPRYEHKKSILTQAEQQTYRSLLRAVEDRYAVMAKVRLWDFIWLANDPAPSGKSILPSRGLPNLRPLHTRAAAGHRTGRSQSSEARGNRR